MKLHHIGIFVKDINFGFSHLEKIIDIKNMSDIIYDGGLKVAVQFLYDADNICYELVSPFGVDNPVDGCLASGKNILNHLAFKSKNFDLDLVDLKKKGYIQLGLTSKALAFNGARVAFILSPLKIIVELIEDNHSLWAKVKCQIKSL